MDLSSDKRIDDVIPLSEQSLVATASGYSELELQTAIRKRMGGMYFNADRDRYAADPNTALINFVTRIVDRDPLVKELILFCEATGAMFQCSDSWYNTDYKEKRFLMLTAKGISVYCTSDKDTEQSLRRTVEQGFEQCNPTDRMSGMSGKFNQSHAEMLRMKSGGYISPAERTLNYLAHIAEKVGGLHRK